MKEFKPTWLYIKTHNTTGLQYLGKTGKKDPIRYKGSGTRWNFHLDKHGNDVSTFLIGYYTDEYECKQMAIFYSWFFDIVKSDDWANLREEDGLEGGATTTGKKYGKETAQKREQTLLREHGVQNASQIPEVKAKKKENIVSRLNDSMGVDNYMSLPEFRDKVGAANRGRKCIYIGNVTKRVQPEEIHEYLEKGWNLGKVNHNGVIY